MPSDEKKPIDEMLEASAKARRAEFGKEPLMPNPMRARLHDEISRVAAERHEPAPERSWLQMFWPRLAVAAALATILVVGPTMWYRSRSVNVVQADTRSGSFSEPREEAARSDEALTQGPAASNRGNLGSAGASPAGDGAPAVTNFHSGPATAAAPNVSLADSERASLTAQQTPPAVADNSLDESKLEAEAQTATDAVTSASGQVTKGFIAKQDKAGEAAPSSANLQPAAPATSQLATKDALGAAAPGAPAAMKAPQKFAPQPSGQAFRNIAPTNRSPNILNNFQVQQQGSDIRIVDADGSTYTGKFEPGGEIDRLAKARRSYAARAESDQKEPSQSQSRFRAAGYNVTLKKSVVVDADYSETGLTEQSQRQKAQSAETQNAARIIGTARVNGEPPVQIDATAVPQ